MGYSYDLYNSVDGNRLNTVNQFTYFNSTSIAAGSSATLSTQPGTLQNVVLNAIGGYNFTLFDGGSVIAQIVASVNTVAPLSIPYNVKTLNGLAITCASIGAAAGGFTITYR